MILKALMTVFGLRAMPTLRNERVHDAQNIRTAALAGHQRAVRLSAVSDRAYSRGDTEQVRRVLDQQSEIRSGLDELTRRLEK